MTTTYKIKVGILGGVVAAYAVVAIVAGLSVPAAAIYLIYYLATQ